MKSILYILFCMLVIQIAVSSQESELTNEQLIQSTSEDLGNGITYTVRWETGFSDIGDPNDLHIAASTFVNLGSGLYRRFLSLDDESGNIGIGLPTNQDAAEAKVQIQHLHTGSGETPALALGNVSNGENGYLTIDQPELDENSNIARFRYNGSTVMRVNKGSAAYQVDVNGTMNADTYLNNSDRRFKTNITNLDFMSDKLLSLKPRTYFLKNQTDDKRMEFGFIAQEIRDVFPNLVIDATEPDMDGNPEKFLSVNYIGLIPVMVKAYQESIIRINSLEKENRDLDKTLHQLIKRIDKLESRSNK